MHQTKTSSIAVSCSIYVLYSHGIMLPLTQQESHVARQNKFVARQKLLTYLVFQLVAQHHSNACDKIRLVRLSCENRVI